MTSQTSFQKQSSTKVPFIRGSKASIRNAQLLISSGVPSLDHVIGGGIPVGTIVLLEEDVRGSYARILLKYFLSEGVVSGHSLLVASQDRDPENLVDELPAVIDDDKSLNSTVGLEDKMDIAWRYQDLKAVDSSPCSNTFGHHFDLTKKVDKTLLAACSINYWKTSKKLKGESSFTNPAFEDLLVYIQETVNNGNFSVTPSVEKRNMLRIAIDSLGSPLWSDDADYEDEMSLKSDTSLFLYNLRGLLRSAYAVCMLTVPSHLYKEPSLIRRIQHLCDTCVRLESFAGSDKETNPAFKEYHGLFHVTKLSAINTIPCHIPDSLDLAFKLRRKKFLIEKLHLPPELQESAQREQDDIFGSQETSGGCGGMGSKNLLDF